MTQPSFQPQPQPHYHANQSRPPAPQSGSAPQYEPIPRHASSSQYQPSLAPHGPLPDTRPEGNFKFDGGAGSFFLVGLGATLLTVITLGIALSWAIAMFYR